MSAKSERGRGAKYLKLVYAYHRIISGGNQSLTKILSYVLLKSMSSPGRHYKYAKIFKVKLLDNDIIEMISEVHEGIG